MTDHELVALFLEHSEQAINELMNCYGTAARSIAANILKNPQDAEECVSEACMQMWNSVPPARPERPGAYFCAITRNVCLSRHSANTARKRNSFYDTALDELGDTVPALSDVETEADAVKLLRCGEIEGHFNFHTWITEGRFFWRWTLAEIDTPDSLTVRVYNDPEAPQTGEVSFVRG